MSSIKERESCLNANLTEEKLLQVMSVFYISIPEQERPPRSNSTNINRWTSCPESLLSVTGSQWVTPPPPPYHHHQTVTQPPCLHLNFTTIRTGLDWTGLDLRSGLSWIMSFLESTQVAVSVSVLTTLHYWQFMFHRTDWLLDKFRKKTENIRVKLRELFTAMLFCR